MQGRRSTRSSGRRPSAAGFVSVVASRLPHHPPKEPRRCEQGHDGQEGCHDGGGTILPSDEIEVHMERKNISGTCGYDGLPLGCVDEVEVLLLLMHCIREVHQ